MAGKKIDLVFCLACRAFVAKDCAVQVKANRHELWICGFCIKRDWVDLANKSCKSRSGEKKR